jgi:hypothetical protein
MAARRKATAKVPGAVMDARTIDQIGLEVVSREARLRLTRLLRATIKANESDIELIRQNKIINLANTVLGRPIYTLELGDSDYEPAEYAWHNGELELVLRRPDTPQLIEILFDLIQAGALSRQDVNAVLEADGCGVRLEDRHDELEIELVDVAELPVEAPNPSEHANVRRLAERMDRAMQDRDWSLVLHTAASMFETVAKQVVSDPNVQNRSLGPWFTAYRNHSSLAVPLLDAIEDIFRRRNIEPLAGHGSTSDPTITEEDAVQVRELTIALVRMETTLAALSVKQAAPQRPRRRQRDQ